MPVGSGINRSIAVPSASAAGFPIRVVSAVNVGIIGSNITFVVVQPAY
jgi:hypothetical protein